MRVLINQRSRSRIDAARLRAACLRALREEGARPDATVSVTALSEREMRELNGTYLNRAGATDVLAFAMGEKSGRDFLLGDVLVCPSYVRRHRGRYATEEGREMELVTVHGLLHLLGYSDQDEDGAEAMDRRAREILRIRKAGGRDGKP